MSMRAVALAILVSALTVGGVQAQSEPVLPSARALIHWADPTSDFTRPSRILFTKNLLTYCRDVLSRIPTNSPREDAWVESERKTPDFDKFARLETTQEWSRYELKSAFSTCEERTQKLIQALATNHNMTEPMARYEAAQLVNIAIAFNEANDIKRHSSRLGLNSRALGFELLLIIRDALLQAALRTLEMM